MKVLLYEQFANAQKTSGIGRALRHQKKALEDNGIEVTFNKSDTYDLVHINSSFIYTSHFLKKCLKKNIPVVVHGHSTYEDFRNSFRLWKLVGKVYFYPNLSRLYSRAPLIITPTEYSKHLIENYKVTKCPVLAISNGIILEEYAYSNEKVKKFKDFFNIQENEKVVVGVGLYFVRKGLLDFIEIARKMPDTKFIWFGHLDKILCQIKINKAIKNAPKNCLFPGYIDGDIIKGALQSASLVFFPTYEETEGIVALEALASKTPLLIRDIPVYDGWLEDNVNCYKGKTNEEFIEKINYICSHDNSSIIENGYEVAKERSIEKVGKKLIKAYDQAIEISKKK